MNITSIVSDIERMARIAHSLERTKGLVGTAEESTKYCDLKNDLLAFAEMLKRKYEVVKVIPDPDVPKFEVRPERCELCSVKVPLIKTRYKFDNSEHEVYIYLCPDCKQAMLPLPPDPPKPHMVRE